MELELLYFHTQTSDLNKGWYYCQSYYFGSTKFYDLKETNNRYSKTLLCASESQFDKYFYTKEQIREMKINEILNV
jgi:hypothetical protein